MTNFSFKRKEDYIEINISNNKTINKLKYEYGEFDNSHFIDYGIEIDVDKNANIFKIYDPNMYSGVYSLFISYTDFSYEVIHFTLEDTTIAERERFITLNSDLINFTDYASLNYNRIKKQLYKLIPCFDQSDSDTNIETLFQKNRIAYSEIPSLFRANSIKIDNITDINNIINFKIDLSNIVNNYLYGFIIISNKNYPITTSKLIKPLYINNDSNILNISFSYIYNNYDIAY